MHNKKASSFSHFSHLPVFHLSMKSRLQPLNNSASEFYDLSERNLKESTMLGQIMMEGDLFCVICEISPTQK